MRRYQMLRIGLVLGLAPGLSACSSSPQGGAQKATNSNSAQRYLSGFELPLAGPLSGFVGSQPSNNPRRAAAHRISNAKAGMAAFYSHGPSVIHYSVWMFPSAAEAKNFNWATYVALYIPMADYTNPQSIPIQVERQAGWKQTAHDRRRHRKYVIARLEKRGTATDAKTVDAIIAAEDRTKIRRIRSGLRVGRFMIVAYASQDLNAIRKGQAKPSLLLSDEQMKQTLRDVMLLLAKRAQARPEGRE